MNPAALIVEILLIGFQALVWSLLLIFTFFGYSWINLDLLKDWSVQISAALIGVAYMLGQIVDGLASAMGDRVFKFRPFIYVYSYKIIDRRMRLLVKNHAVYEYFEKRRNQNRLLRATFLNLVIISVSAFAFITLRLTASWKLITFTCVSLLILLGITFFSWRRFSWILYQELDHACGAVEISNRASTRTQ